jgi:hypothetical protein
MRVVVAVTQLMRYGGPRLTVGGGARCLQTRRAAARQAGHDGGWQRSGLHMAMFCAISSSPLRAWQPWRR